MRGFLKERHSKTLTELYNALVEHHKNPSGRSEWVAPLDKAHRDLDKAVHAAYGWEYPLPEEQVLERLLTLNLERPAAEGSREKL
ncbi:MAG: hypothetical protein IVW51_04605 [Thermaceae bacterium]|nr:hypothetical protein [Thermaceae bacterium]